MDLHTSPVNQGPEDDLTQPTSFGVNPPQARRNGEHQQRIAAVLATYCTPQLKYDGISAWEIAGKVLDALAPSEPSDSTVRR